MIESDYSDETAIFSLYNLNNILLDTDYAYGIKMTQT